MDGIKLRNRDMGMEGKRGSRKDRRKIFEVDIGSGCEDAGLSDKRGDAKRKDEDKAGREGPQVLREDYRRVEVVG